MLQRKQRCLTNFVNWQNMNPHFWWKRGQTFSLTKSSVSSIQTVLFLEKPAPDRLSEGIETKRFFSFVKKWKEVDQGWTLEFLALDAFYKSSGKVNPEGGWRRIHVRCMTPLASVSFQGYNTDWTILYCMYLSAWDHYLNSPWPVFLCSEWTIFCRSVPGHTDLNKMRQKNPKTLPLAWQIYSDRHVPCHHLWHLTYLVWHTQDMKHGDMPVSKSFCKSHIFCYRLINDWNIESVEWVTHSVCQSVTHHNNIFHCQSVSQSLNYHYSAVCREIASISLTVCTWLLMLYGNDFLILKCCWNLHCLFFVLCAMCEPLLKKPRTTVEPNQPEPDPEPGLVDLDKPCQTQDKLVPAVKTKFHVSVGFQEVGQSGSRNTHKMNWTEWFRQTTDIGGKMPNMIQIAFAGSVISFWKSNRTICCSMTI